MITFNVHPDTESKRPNWFIVSFQSDKFTRDMYSYFYFTAYKGDELITHDDNDYILYHVFVGDSIWSTVETLCKTRGLKPTNSILRNALAKHIRPLFEELFVNVLTEFGFTHDDSNFYKVEGVGIEEVQDLIEKIINRMLEVAEEILNDETVFDSSLEEIQAVIEEKRAIRSVRTSRFAPEASAYTVWCDHRNGFMDCDRKPRTVTSLEEIKPEDVSWVPFSGDFLENEEQHRDVCDRLITAGIANAYLDEAQTCIYLPIIKVQTDNFNQKLSLVWSFKDNRWITLLVAKKEAGVKIGAEKFANCRYLQKLQQAGYTITL